MRPTTLYQLRGGDFSQYKIKTERMLVMKRKLLSVLLALALVVSMAVPALANPWSGEWGGVQFELSANKRSSSGTVTMRATNVNVGVNAGARATVEVLILGQNLTGSWNTVYGDMIATSTVNNYVYDAEGNLHSGGIVTLAAKGYVGSNPVMTKYI